jgi:hypothetical protein
MAIKYMRNLIERTKRATLWSRALDAYRAGRTTESIALINKMGDIGPLQHYHLVFLGTAYILSKDSLKARHYLQEAKKLTDHLKHPSGRYVNVYAKLYLTMMDTDAPVDSLVREALSINCRSSLKRWLPVTAQQNGVLSKIRDSN